MADGTMTFVVDMDDSKAQAQLNKLKKEIEDLGKEIDTATRKRDYAAEKLKQARAMQASWKEGTTPFSKAEWESMYGQDITKYQTQVDTLNQEIADLTSKLATAKTEAGGVAKRLASAEIPVEQTEQQVEEIDEKVEETNRDLEKTEQQMIKVGNATKTSSKHMSGIKSHAAGLGKKLLSMVKAVFIFQAISAALRGVKQWLGGVIQADSELSASLAQLKGALRTAAQPILQVLIPALRTLITWITKAVTAIASLIASLFGSTIEQSAAAAESLYNEQNALEGVGGAAGKAAKSMAGFDEINQLTAQSGGGGGGAQAVDFKPIEGYGDILDKLKGFMDKYHINEAIDKIKNSINNLAAAWKNFIDSPTGKYLKQLLVDITGDSLYLGLTLIADALQIIADVLNGDWKSAWEHLKELGLDVYIGLAQLIADIFGKGDEFREGKDKVKKAILENGLFGAADALAKDKELQDVVKQIKEGRGNENPFEYTDTGTGTPMDELDVWWFKFKQSFDEYKKKWDDAWDTLSETAGAVWANFKQSWNDEWDLFVADLSIDWKDIKDWWAVVKSRIVDAWWVLKSWWHQNITPAIDNIFQPFKDAWEAIKTFYETNIKTPIEKAGEAVGEAFTNGLDSGLAKIKEIINGLIGTIETALNWIVNKVNSISIDIPNKGIYGDFAGQHIGFNLQPISIPRLAQGAVIPPNKEFLAMLGDQRSGTNIEAPLDTIVAAFRQAVGGNVNRPIVLMLDRRELGRAVVDVYGQETARVGLKLGGVYG